MTGVKYGQAVVLIVLCVITGLLIIQRVLEREVCALGFSKLNSTKRFLKIEFFFSVLGSFLAHVTLPIIVFHAADPGEYTFLFGTPKFKKLAFVNKTLHRTAFLSWWLCKNDFSQSGRRFWSCFVISTSFIVNNFFQKKNPKLILLFSGLTAVTMLLYALVWILQVVSWSVDYPVVS